MKLRMTLDSEHPPVVFLTGNLSEGFEAYGPYDNMDDACNAHEGEEGWLMTLNMVKVFSRAPASRFKLV
jgi:hypothetical protein